MSRIEGGSHIPQSYNPNLESVRPMSKEMIAVCDKIKAMMDDLNKSHLDIDPSKPDTAYWLDKGNTLIGLTTELEKLLLQSEISDKEPIYGAIKNAVAQLRDVGKQMSHKSGVAETDQRQELCAQMNVVLSQLASYRP